MSRLHQALERSRGSGASASGRAGESEGAGLEAPAGGRTRVPTPWRFDEDVPARPLPAPERPPSPASPAPAARPARRVFPVWLAVALPGAAVGLYLLARATGNLAAGGTLRLTGLVAANEVVVAAKTAGRIRELAVREGSWVRPGDVIARLDREELDAERQHQLALIEQLSAKLRQGREVVTLEGDRGRGRVASAEAQLHVARSQRDEAAASLDQLRKDDERALSLSREGLLSRQEVERIHTDVRVTEARLKSLADQVSRAEAELDLARANERQTGVAQRDVEQTQAQIGQARAQLAQVAARLGDTEVRAPLPGMVSARVAREGEVIRLGDPIVTIVDLDDVWARAEVEESYVSRVVVGQILEVELASGERLRGRVTFIEPEAQFATQRDVSRVKRDIRTFGIKVALPNPGRRLHQGMTAYVLVPDPPRAPADGG